MYTHREPGDNHIIGSVLQMLRNLVEIAVQMVHTLVKITTLCDFRGGLMQIVL